MKMKHIKEFILKNTSIMNTHNIDHMIIQISDYKDRQEYKKQLKIFNDEWILLSEYSPSHDKLIKWSECHQYTNDEDSHNACCGDNPHSGCTNTYRYIYCKTPNYITDYNRL